MMRTTLNLDDQLLQRAKEEAARTRRTLSAVIEDALRTTLSNQTEAERRPYVVRPLAGGDLRPGVNLSDSATLLDLMDDR